MTLIARNIKEIGMLRKRGGGCAFIAKGSGGENVCFRVD